MNPRDLTRPHLFIQGKDRVLLLLHGTGGDENDLLRLGAALDPGAFLLSPRGMYLEAGMNRFFERYPDGSFNEDSIRTATDELADFLAAAVAEYSLDGLPIFAAGFSNGANTAVALMVTHPAILSGAILFGSTRPFKNIANIPDLRGKRIWIANGTQDPYAPAEVTRAWAEQLRAFGADVELLEHPAGHQISPAHLQEISRQLA